MADLRDLPDSTNALVERAEPSPTILAITSDGRLIVSSVDLAFVDLTGRELFSGVYLTDAEAERARVRIDNTVDEIASRLIGSLPKR